MLADYAPIFPELFIALAAIVLLLWGAYHRHDAGFSIGIVAIFVLGGGALLHFTASACFAGAFRRLICR